MTLALTGCGGQPTVVGVVTIDGQPLQASDDRRGTVIFYPTAGGASPATASIQSDGTYDVYTGSKRGLPPGDYGVSINAIRVIPSKVEGSEPGAERLLPRRYSSPKTSGLSVTVEPGSNTYDIALESAQN